MPRSQKDRDSISKCHIVFDRLWKGHHRPGTARGHSYTWLRDFIGVRSHEDAHIGSITVDDRERVISFLSSCAGYRSARSFVDGSMGSGRTTIDPCGRNDARDRRSLRLSVNKAKKQQGRIL